MLNFLLVGNDAGASRAIAKVGAAAEATSKSIATASDKQAAAAARVSKAFNAIGKASALVTVAIGIAGVKAAVSFEQSLTRVSTQAGVSQKDLKGLGDQLLKLSPKVGFNPNDLATSLYHVESAFASTGITAGKAIDIVEQASRLAKIGNADLGDTTQAIIGVLASGIKGVKDATDAAAQLNQLVGSGDTTLSAVDKAIASGILPTAQALGLSFKDVAAALATLTDNATPADEAATRLRTTFTLIANGSPKAVAALQSIGIAPSQLAEDLRKPDGLLTALTDLRTHLEATYPASRSTKLSTDEIAASTKAYTGQLLAQGVQAKVATDLGNKYAASLKNGGTSATQQAKVILDAFGGAKSGSTFLTLYEEFARYESKVKEFGTSAQAAAKFQAAWAQQQKTARQKLDDLKASWDVFLIKVGNAILPDLKKIVDVLSKHPGVIKDAAVAVGIFAAAWVAVKVGSIVAGLGRIATALLGVRTAAIGAATAEASVGAAGAGAAGARAATGAFAAGGAATAGSSARFAGLAASPLLTKVALPVALTVVAIKTAQGTEKVLKDLGEHQYGKALTDGLNNTLINGLTFGISGGIAKAIKSGDWVKALGPGAGLAQKALGGLIPGGGLTGSLAKDFDKATPPVSRFFEEFNKGGPTINTFQRTLENAKTLLDSDTNSLDGNTAGAVSNRKGLQELTFQAVVASQAYEKSTGHTGDFTRALALSIPQILDQAQATGLNRQQTADYINTLLKIPGFKVTTVGLDGTAAAQAQVAAFLQSLAQIPAVIRVPIETFIASPTPANQLAGSAFGVDTVGRHAAGGLLRGRGSGTSDSMLARVSNGEFVVKASSVNRYGVGFLNAINAGSYARGGYIGSAVRAGGGDVHVHVHAWDGPSVDKWLQQGGAKKIAIEVKRATGYGMTLN